MLSSHSLKFNFQLDSGILNYLNRKSFVLEKSTIKNEIEKYIKPKN